MRRQISFLEACEIAERQERQRPQMLAPQQQQRIYAGDDMDASGWMTGEYDSGRILRDARLAHLARAQGRVQGRLPAPQPPGGAAHPLVQTVEVAEAAEKAQQIEDRGKYNFPITLGIIAPAAFLAAAPITNTNGVTPPREFFAEKIVILGADLISIEDFRIMGEPLTQGTSSVTATQFRTDSTMEQYLNMVIDTTPITFRGTCITAGTVGVSIVGYLKKMGSRRA